MKTMTIDELREHLVEPLTDVAEEMVVVIRDGKPWAVFKPFVEEDDDSDEYVNDPAFWRMIEERRREPTIPWDEAMRQLGLPEFIKQPPVSACEKSQ
jgi:hypothetical protein